MGVWGRSPLAAEENLQFWGQNIADFWAFLHRFLTISQQSFCWASVYGINGLPPKLCLIICVYKINSVLNNYIKLPSPDCDWTRVGLPYVNLENLAWVTMWCNVFRTPFQESLTFEGPFKKWRLFLEKRPVLNSIVPIFLENSKLFAKNV